MTTSSFESNLHKGNNTSRVWSYLYDENNQKYRQAAGNYTVVISVDDPSPVPGDTVNFTITADLETPAGYTGIDVPPIDTKVDIELTGGLSVSGAPAFASGALGISTVPDSVSYSSGVFTVGTLTADDVTQHSVTLPITVASNAVVSEQCLNAKLAGNPPPGTGPIDDDISDNVERVCLGEPPPGSFLSGQVNAFTLYPCVDVTSAPCNSDQDIRVRAVRRSPAGLVVPPGTALLWVDEYRARIYDSTTGHSVNDGNTVSWQTRDAIETGSFTGVGSGLEIYYNYEPFNNHVSNWSGVAFGLSAFNAQGSQPPPGKVYLRHPAAGVAIRKVESPNWLHSWTAPTSTSLTLSSGPVNFFLEFEKLGTYQVKFLAVAKPKNNHGSGSENCASTSGGTNDLFCASETYIFHVGPMADIAVEDGGASPRVAAGQNALAIVAVNNGPDDSASTQVTGLPTGAQVVHISHGSYDSSDGVWNIGELKVSDYYRSRGEPVQTLVLGASTGDTASVSIASTNNYEVCVGPKNNPGNLDHTTQAACEAVTNASWNSTRVYDHNAANNTATIIAARGTGGVGEGIPSLDTPSVHSPSVGIEWDEVDYLYGVPVMHYETQWSSDGTRRWRELEDEIPVTESLDADIEAGETRYYRVRAVNEAGEPGPWSAPKSVMVEEEVMATAGAPGKPVLIASPKSPDRREEILVSWTKPVENGSPIVSYTLEVSDTGRDNSWSDSGATLTGSSTSWTHTGLTGGTRKFYRLLATNLCDATNPTIECHGPWSDTVNATTDPPGQSGPPTNVRAVPDGDSAVDISWDPPVDDGGSPIRYYEVQWSADGTSGWSNAGRTPDGETLTFKNTGMTFGTTRHYRVAARNGVTLGDWSDPPVSATTLAGVPGMPNLTARATDANTIDLTWTVPADNGSAIIRYELEWSPDGDDGTWASLANPSETDTSYSDGGLDPGTERHYRIRAVNGATPGEGSWSTVRSAKTPPAVPGAPFLRAEANGQNAIDLLWEPPSDDGGADISEYEVYVSSDGTDSSYSSLTSLTATARSYTHSGLDPGDERYYRLRARNQAGWGEFSEHASEVTLTGVPAAPVLTARANGASEIKLSWTKPDDRGSDIVVYHLQESDDGNDWSNLDSGIAADATEYVHTGLGGWHHEVLPHSRHQRQRRRRVVRDPQRAHRRRRTRRARTHADGDWR